MQTLPTTPSASHVEEPTGPPKRPGTSCTAGCTLMKRWQTPNWVKTLPSPLWWGENQHQRAGAGQHRGDVGHSALAPSQMFSLTYICTHNLKLSAYWRSIPGGVAVTFHESVFTGLLRQACATAYFYLQDIWDDRWCQAATSSFTFVCLIYCSEITWKLDVQTQQASWSAMWRSRTVEIKVMIRIRTICRKIHILDSPKHDGAGRFPFKLLLGIKKMYIKLYIDRFLVFKHILYYITVACYKAN